MKSLRFGTCLFCMVLAAMLTRSAVAVLPIGEAIEVTADRLEATQIIDGNDPAFGAWPLEADYTGSIVPGMVGAHELTCHSAYRTSAELGGDYIRYAYYTSCANLYGDEAFALMRLSQIAPDPCNNLWRDIASEFFRSVKHDVNGTEAYIAQFVGAEPSTAVFYLAHHAVAAYYVDAEDKHLWRQGVIDFLAQVDDESSDFPVLGLGVATWALAQTGPMDSTLVDPNGIASPYWSGVTLADLPAILQSHQVPPQGHPRPGKIVQMILEYTGEGCDASKHNQAPDKVSCSGDPNGAQPVNIVVSNESGTKIWGTLTNGSVGDLVFVDAANAGQTQLDSSTLVRVFDANGVLLQRVVFHTSGSQPLNIGDQFGSMLVVGITTDQGVFPGGWFYWRFDHRRSDRKPLKEEAGFTEDTIFGTLGLIAASEADPNLDFEDSLLTARRVLLDGIESDGTVYEHLSRKGAVYYTYAGEMLHVLGELVIPADLDIDGGVNFVDYAIFVNWWGDPGCTWGSCWCDRSDLDHDGDVDYDDLEIFADYWLKGVGQ